LVNLISKQLNYYIMINFYNSEILDFITDCFKKTSLFFIKNSKDLNYGFTEIKEIR
jgi:predicted P-loop ATPase/GTPase